MASTLSSVTRYAGRVTAVVSVADDGGSSGRLKQSWSGPAPGDVRRCLLALAGPGADDQSWAKAFDYRFRGGELDGHSLGNLVLVALSETTGDFGKAVAQVGRLLGAQAEVLPATAGAVVLCAALDTPAGPVQLAGQAKVTRARGRLRRVWLEPAHPSSPPAVLEAIAAADQVVLGPGSLFTSVLAVCAVPAIREALAGRSGGRTYVCNLGPEDQGETAGFSADDHVAALVEHGVTFDNVVCDRDYVVQGVVQGVGQGVGQGVVPGAARQGQARPPEVLSAPLAQGGGRFHDPVLLAAVLSRLAVPATS